MSNEYECFSGLYFWPAPSVCWVRPTSPFSTPLQLSRMTTLTQRQSKISHKSKWTQMFASKVIKNIFSRYSRLKRMSKVVHSAERWFFQIGGISESVKWLCNVKQKEKRDMKMTKTQWKGVGCQWWWWQSRSGERRPRWEKTLTAPVCVVRVAVMVIIIIVIITFKV